MQSWAKRTLKLPQSKAAALLTKSKRLSKLPKSGGEPADVLRRFAHPLSWHTSAIFKRLSAQRKESPRSEERLLGYRKRVIPGGGSVRFSRRPEPGIVSLQFERRQGLSQAHPDRETPMPVLCMLKKDSTLPLCDTHNVMLKEQQIPIDSNAPALGRITCYVCPVSNSVVREPRGAYAHNSN